MNEDISEMIEEFVEKNNIDKLSAQWRVIQEERAELDGEITSLLFGKEHNIEEEIADEIITLLILAEMLDVDYKEEVKEKMEYNLEKSGKKNEHGKVVDDV